MDQKRLRIRYLFDRARRLNPTQLLELAHQVKRISKAPVPVIIGDMLWCSVRYEMGFRDYVVWDIRMLKAAERRTWMTHPKAFRLNKTLNAPEARQLLQDKKQFLIDFADLTHREWIDAATATDDETRDFLSRHPRVIAKPAAGEGGAGISIYESAEITDVAAWRAELVANDQTLLEQVLAQHDDLNAVYPDSVNTVRMITYRDPHGELHVIASVLRIGNGAVIDNFASGGMFTMLDDEGVALYPAVDKQSNIYREHPRTGMTIKGIRVPFFDRVVEMVTEASTRLPTVPYVGWDIAITPEGPALIEANHNSSVFQMKPSASGIRTGLLHRYRDAIGADIVDKR
ncbi:sugar-transfer associated ATP-grasp domain-containing protein [uncultured Microbacterium sp.]|uniref:sugar-transfer associated ATP-grasp domain-containing protein n=1 Tax=uncultured Microbacterium sp. TaxID=191216 RepID=UPI00261E5D3F|nr:sugar-transfer associated ATP-grasp domain-containing protein [uncultured Microbacterium sp.]